MNDVVAFVVGLDVYNQPDFTTSGPCANAVSVSNWLLDEGVTPAKLFVFLSPSDGVRGAVSELASRGAHVVTDATQSAIDGFWRKELPAQDGSRLFVYWSGHGYAANDGRRIFVCRDFEHPLLGKRVFDATAFMNELRGGTYQAFRKQVLIADVCGSHSEIEMPAAERAPAPALPLVEQLAFFATPDGDYARGLDDRGLFTTTVLEVLKQGAKWPNSRGFAEDIRKALRQLKAPQTRLIAHDDDGIVYGSAGVAPMALGPVLASLHALLSQVAIGDAELERHYLQVVARLHMPKMARAQGLIGMLTELTKLGDATAEHLPHGLLDFLVRLESTPQLAKPITRWLGRHARDQRQQIKSLRDEVSSADRVRVLVVEVICDASGNIEGFRPHLRSLALEPVPGVSLPAESGIRGWEDFQTRFASLLDRLLGKLAQDGDLQIQFLVDPPALFDRSFHAIDVAGTPLGQRFVVVLRYRLRVLNGGGSFRSLWEKYAREVRATEIASIPVLVIPGGPCQLPPKAGICCVSWLHEGAPVADSILRGKALMRLLLLGFSYLSWPQGDSVVDGVGARDEIDQWVRQLERLDQYPEVFAAKRIEGSQVALESALLWDDPLFRPILKAKGVDVR